MAKISEMSDEDAAAALLKAYRGMCEVYDADEHGSHPSHTVNQWIRAAAAGASPGASERQIQKGQDNPPETPGTPKPPAPAEDGRYTLSTDGIPRFETGNGQVLTGDAALKAHAAQSDPSRVRRMAGAIEGYDRLK